MSSFTVLVSCAVVIGLVAVPRIVRGQSRTGASEPTHFAGSLSDLGEPAKFLNADLKQIHNLQPPSAQDRLDFQPKFEGEELHLGPDQQWLGREWQVHLGSANGSVYKVALETHPPNREEAVKLSVDVSRAIDDKLGKGEQPQQGIFFWNASDGNAVMQLGNIRGDRFVMVFLTSRRVKQFRLRQAP